MSKRNKKQELAAGDELVKHFKAKAKRDELLREILPRHMVDDPVERRRILRGGRRDAPWNKQKKRA